MKDYGFYYYFSGGYRGSWWVMLVPAELLSAYPKEKPAIYKTPFVRQQRRVIKQPSARK